MEPDIASPLLGGLSPAQFMRRHWQKKPLLVRQALPGITPPLPRARLFELAARDGVESRLVQQRDGVWSLRHGPLPRRALPPLARPHWTLLVQGLDLHEPAAHALLRRFGFVPDARLDDLMLSYASDGGGVGPHLDSYDVFLIQVHGQRRWRIARTRDHTLVEGVPLKILRHFAPEQEWLLQPGDMLYLPPGVARLKFDGGHGGQNGLRDIFAHLGHGKFHRLRIGIGHPGHKDRVTSWVLGKPGHVDEQAMLDSIKAALDVLPLAIAGDFSEAMKQLHTGRE